ncbi:ABC transporter substrate-binding protein [Nonomuraea ferruginea]
MPHSGPLAAYGYIGDGLKNYLSYVNANGGVGGRTIQLDILDDHYQPDLTRKNVDKAIQENKYAASVAILGSSNNGAIRDVMNDECMPHLLVASSEDRWGDVENYPWTTGMGLNYGNEAGLWKRWISDKYPDGATVAVVAMNNDFGKAYEAAFTDAAEGSNIKIVAKELIDPSAPNMTDQLTSAAASKAQVAIFAVAGDVLRAGHRRRRAQLVGPGRDHGQLVRADRDVAGAAAEGGPDRRRHHGHPVLLQPERPGEQGAGVRRALRRADEEGRAGPGGRAVHQRLVLGLVPRGGAAQRRRDAGRAEPRQHRRGRAHHQPAVPAAGRGADLEDERRGGRLPVRGRPDVPLRGSHHQQDRRVEADRRADQP